jgi:uncharacterized OsmC-like protein
MSDQNNSLETVNTLNGVDVNHVVNAVNAFVENEELANFKFHLKNKWIEGGHSQSKITSCFGASQENTHDDPFELNSDVHPIFAGKDRGASPPEHFLNALASCLTTTLVYHAAVQGIKIEELESEIEGDIDFRGMLGISDDIRKGYENIRVNFKIKSDTDDIEKLKELTTFSPILDVAQNGTNVDVSIESK